MLAPLCCNGSCRYVPVVYSAHVVLSWTDQSSTANETDFTCTLGPKWMQNTFCMRAIISCSLYIYLSPNFWRLFLCFQRGFFRLICPYVWFVIKSRLSYGSWVKMKLIPLISMTKRPQTFLDSIYQNRTLCLVWYILKVLLLNGLKEDKQLLLHLHYLWNEVLMYTY